MLFDPCIWIRGSVILVRLLSTTQMETKKYSSILPSAGFIKPALEHATFTVIIAKKRLCWSSLELFGVVRISLEVAQTLNFLLPDLVSGLLQQV